MGDITWIQKRLEELGDQAEARKIAMAKMATQTDHMASAEAPYAHGEETTESNDPLAYQEIADRLNALAREAYLEIRKGKEAKAAQPAVQKPTKALEAFISKRGEDVEGHPGVKKLQGTALLNHLRNDPDASKDQISLVRRLVDRQILDGATYYFGTEEAMAGLRRELTPGTASQPLGLGAYSTNAGGVVFIANTAPETVLHEMLHSHTWRILRDFYDDPRTVEPYARDAIRRLESLMEKTRGLNIAGSDALRTIQGELTRLEDKPAQQMSEFLSWMLANQELIEIGRKKRAYLPLTDLIRKGLEALKQLLGIKRGPGDSLFTNIRFNTEILLATPQRSEASRQNAQTETLLQQV
ncbi:hypothetical protein HMH01_13045 [Halovulum dunhuangense]|uniref:Uncharacterized protein n=2 Tax=Halovulum dunhuangense TaxID=1505036 RepID=A0A849L5B2_9RHOB|nr:hypothetical protein [Halovulum dunhuangense]